MNREIPKDKSYPADSVQCDACGGWGWPGCGDRGWFTPALHSRGRRCEYEPCGQPLHPSHTAVYCSAECAMNDAHAATPSQARPDRTDDK
jgi:hypothetical protein